MHQFILGFWDLVLQVQLKIIQSYSWYKNGHNFMLMTKNGYFVTSMLKESYYKVVSIFLNIENNGFMGD